MNKAAWCNSPAALLLLLLLPLLLLGGCEQFFSTNLFAGLERDPSQLSFEQQVTYARNALSSNYTRVQAKAYDALADSLARRNNSDPELNSLAANLAIGASGLPKLLGDFLSLAFDDAFDSTTELADRLDPKLGKVNYGYIDQAVAQIDAVGQNGGTPSEQQYILALAGLVMKAGNEGDGIADPAIDWTEVNALLIEAEADHQDSDYVAQFRTLIS